VSPYTAKQTQATQQTPIQFLQVACIKTIGLVLRHIANGKAFDCLRYGDPGEKRKGPGSLYNAKDFDYALSVLLEVMDTSY